MHNFIDEVIKSYYHGMFIEEFRLFDVRNNVTRNTSND